MLLLFDIDGTLLVGADEPHFAAMRQAIADVFGAHAAEDDGVEKQGRTDCAIARDVAEVAGVAPGRYDAERERFAARWVECFTALAPDRMDPLLAPGIRGALEQLTSDGGHRLGLVTGNLREIAAVKLTRAGVDRFFDLAVAGYGSDHEDRSKLPPLARARAGGVAGPVPRRATLLIGDTPRDIACAHADGLRCIAVTTGHFAAADLEAAEVVAESADEVVSAVARFAGEAAVTAAGG